MTTLDEQSQLYAAKVHMPGRVAYVTNFNRRTQFERWWEIKSFQERQEFIDCALPEFITTDLQDADTFTKDSAAYEQVQQHFVVEMIAVRLTAI